MEPWSNSIGYCEGERHCCFLARKNAGRYCFAIARIRDRDSNSHVVEIKLAGIDDCGTDSDGLSCAVERLIKCEGNCGGVWDNHSNRIACSRLVRLCIVEGIVTKNQFG